MVWGEASLGANGPASLGESSCWAGQWKDGSILLGRAKGKAFVPSLIQQGLAILPAQPGEELAPGSRQAILGCLAHGSQR